MKNFIAGLKEALSLVRSKLWPFIAPLLKSGANWVMEVLTDIATTFVEEVEKNPDFLGNGDAKREWVFEKMKGHEFVTANKIAGRLINLAIELAVNRLSEEKSQSPKTTS